MGKPTEQWKALGEYLIAELWGDDGVPAVMLCHDDDEIAKELLDYVKANPTIDPDAAAEKAIELRKKKFGRDAFPNDIR